MKVKVLKCEASNVWYYNRIGEVFNVREIPNDDVHYLVLDEIIFSDLYDTYFIAKDNCEIVPDEQLIKGEKKMKVKVLKCDNESCWYHKRIGEVFNVKQDPEDKDYWIVLDKVDFYTYPILDDFFIDKSDCVIVSNEVKASEKSIEDYPIADLMLWRNKASARVDEIDIEINEICELMYIWYKKVIKLQKKRKHDIKWIVKLNKILDRKVFKDRSI